MQFLVTGPAHRAQVRQHILVTQSLIRDVMHLKRPTMICRPPTHHAAEPVDLHPFELLLFPRRRPDIFLIECRVNDSHLSRVQIVQKVQLFLNSLFFYENHLLNALFTI